ncbi:MAG: sigma-54 dependent transcriptional regulator [Candidatus Neomarinimicrobiota bacterium]
MTAKSGKILIVDDNEDILVAARLLLKQHVELVRTERNPQKLPYLLKNESFDVILLDMNFTQDMTSGREGFHWLEKILALDADAVVILITAYGDVEMAVRAVKAGAIDFVLKPWQNEKLLATVNAALRLRQSRAEVGVLRRQQQQLSADMDQRFHDIIGNSTAMREVYATIGKVAGTDANVLILGENGTGKELVARALHRQSQRAGEVFISVDMGAITETLFESELFGHVKGAFTDAREDRPGRFEVASGGTLFFDEIGNLSLPLQAKLLRVLEDRQVTRLGSHRPVPFDIRLICATNRALDRMVRAEKFRQDLLFRINTVEIHLPALRDRQGDIPLLADHFIENFARKYQKPVRGLSTAAVAKLNAYHWPGNIRELRHSIERAIILTDSALLEADDFICTPPDSPAEGLNLPDYQLDHVEKTVIENILQKHSGNISHAARELGVTRTTLYRRMQKYGI